MNQSVFDMQTRLGVISDDNPDIPYVYSDGIYGPETTASVEAFQEYYGLESTGIVDYETWLKINDVYDYTVSKKAPTSPIYPFRVTLYDGSLRSGDKSDLVYIIQAMFEKLKLTYDVFDGTAITGVYDEATEKAVFRFQELIGLPATGAVDRATWDRLAAAYNIREYDE